MAIVACDFGKTFLVMLVAKMFDEHLVTVFIVPITGMQSDVHERAARHGLRVARYKHSSTLDPAANFVIVSVELAVSDDFYR